MSTTTPLRILIINPNTSQHMTHALEPAIKSLGYPEQTARFTFFTSPEPGIPSINSPDDAAKSAKVCLPALKPLVADHDAFLVCCYSEHPLVQLLRAECDTTGKRQHVTGIFEASVTVSLTAAGAAGAHTGFGIVSTGKVWETALATAVQDFLGGSSARFLGCETTGLTAVELHQMPPEEVRVRMMEATKRLVLNGKQKGVGLRAVCLGCAGMVGLEEAVRDALVQEMGSEEGQRVSIVDGVKAGVGELIMLGRSGF